MKEASVSHDNESRMEKALPLLILDSVKVNIAGNIILSGLNMTIRPGEHWAVIGKSGSGKTTLLKTLSGHHAISGGTITSPQAMKIFKEPTENVKQNYWHHFAAWVDSKPHFRTGDGVTQIYYQQRFNAGDAAAVLNAGDYLLQIKSAYETSEEKYTQIVKMLSFTPQLEKPLIQLSSGETRRLMIAAALLKRPNLLLMDMPTTGLDTEGKAMFENLLIELSAAGCTVIITTLANNIPKAINIVAVLKDGKIEKQYLRSVYNAEDAMPDDHFEMDIAQLNHLFPPTAVHPFDTLIKLKNVTIKYGESIIIDNLNWEVLPGEKWAVVGPNGAGKSTLLSLINADHPQAYANEIYLFDRKRGTGESIWDIKKNTGFVSAELFQYFPTEQNCLQIIESGFYDTMGLFRQSHPEKEKRCAEWMQLFEIGSYSRKLFNQLPTGAQRLVLLIRALVKNPALLILDEPAQGLNDYQQQHFKSIISHICKNEGMSMLYVTHQYLELPSCVENVLLLSKGQPARKISRSQLMIAA
jgi:molybdate transport system ATP-binding protein